MRRLFTNFSFFAAFWAAFLLVFFVSPNGPAFAQSGQEVIKDFRVDIKVRKDRSIDVTETITFNVLGQQIKRGILRDIVVRYQRDDGSRLTLDVGDISVLRNGKSETYEKSYNGRFLSLRIGNADYFLPHGEHVYTISYNVADFVAYFDDVEEVYWNAIGTGWTFPIENARVSLALPQGGRIRQSVIYTGSDGSTASDGKITKQSDTYIEYIATRRLGAREGMTIAVGWEKGLIPPPTEAELRTQALIGNSPSFIVYILGFLQLGWLYKNWRKVGRDPERGVVIPRYRPPKDMSPALSAYIAGMGSYVAGNQKGFMAALVNLAIKGYLIIDESGKKLTVRRGERLYDDEKDKLPIGEQVIMDYHFNDHYYDSDGKLVEEEGDNRLVFADQSYKQMSSTLRAFDAGIEKTTNEIYFNRNIGKVVPAIASVIIAMIAYLASSVILNPVDMPPILSIVAGLFTGFAIYGLYKLWNWDFWISKLLTPLLAVALVLCIAFVGSMAILVPGELDLSFMEFISFVLIALMTASIPIGFELMKAPTEAGQKIIDEVDGLKLFMTVAVAQKVEAMDMPELTPSLYEKLLPYAIALGVDKEWTQNFEKLVFSQLPPDEDYSPNWYTAGRDDRYFSGGQAVSSMTRAMSSDLSQAMTPPASSSSGSSGGGSSGGGGGGGGGSGW
ncbi:MAG: DUF2207 domain-containing protein [Cohaesibacter sp.]|jgi:uncharacterized membrane protein|nr:DUF2207 domain-containing protein [Cohaesibacter sp.]